MKFREAWNAIVTPFWRSGELPQSEREATTPALAYDVAAYFAEVEQIKAEQAMIAETDAGCARAKQLRLKRAAAAFKGIANAKVRG